MAGKPKRMSQIKQLLQLHGRESPKIKHFILYSRNLNGNIIIRTSLI